MLSARTIIFIVAAAFCTSCYKRPSITLSETKTVLPGFEISLPAGVFLTSSMNPAGGTHEMQRAGAKRLLPTSLSRFFPDDNLNIKVSWRAQVLTESEWRDMYTAGHNTMETTLKSKGRTRMIADRIWLSELQLDGAAVAMGSVWCEPWLDVTVVIGRKGAVSDVVALVSPILKSVRCKLASKSPPTLYFDLPLPSTFGKLADSGADNYVSLDGVAVSVTHTTGDIARNEKLLKPILGGIIGWAAGSKSPLNVTTHPISRKDGAKSTMSVLEGDLGDVGKIAYIATLYCNELDLTGMAMMFGESVSLDYAKTLGADMQCPTDRNEGRIKKSVSEVFGYACETGNADACIGLADLIDQKSATEERGSSEYFRAKACKLGVQTDCK